MNKFWDKSNLWLVVYLLLYIGGLIGLIGFDHPFWTDEHHFYDTIQLFYSSISIENLRHYNEMSTPLPFIIYALWAKIGGLNLVWLRVLSILIAVSTFLTFFTVTKNCFDARIALLATIFMSLNPYMFGVSFFVYTDMTCIGAIVMALYFIQKENIIMITLSCALSIWCRQYAIFFTATICFYYFVQFIQTKQTIFFIKSIIVGSAVLTIIPLLTIWGGLSPINEMNKLYLGKPLTYQANGLSAYLVAIGIYCFPILIYGCIANLKTINIKVLIGLFIVSMLYYWAPISPSVCSIEAGFTSIGFVDKLLHQLISRTFFIDVLYQLILYMSLVSIYLLWLKAKNSKLVLLTLISIMCFLLVMPFSYIVWEKYILLLLPIIIIGYSSIITIDSKHSTNKQGLIKNSKATNKEC